MSTSQSEDIVIVDSADYAQVVFDDVCETYTNSKPLECTFTYELLKKDDSNEWIGIYKVGFSNCSEFICYLPVESECENKGKVVFPIEVLPKEDKEFYQFVFVSNSKQIRGASVPFQFKSEDCSGYSDDEDQDAVVVKFENDTMTEVKHRCIELSTANQKYEKVINDNEQIIKSLKDEVAAIKLRCFRLTMDNEKLNFTLRNKADSLKNLAETITTLTAENKSLEAKFNDLSTDNKNLLDSLQKRIDQVASLKNELESVKLEEIKDLECQVSERTNELNQIKDDLRNNNIVVNEQAITIQTILNEKEALACLAEKLSIEKADLEKNNEDLKQELEMTCEKLETSEQCKVLISSQLETVTKELEETKNKMNMQLNIANDMTDRLAQIENEKNSYDLKLKQIKEEHEEKLNQINGSCYVLRVAHTSLENRLKTSEQKREVAEKESDNHRKELERIRQENEDLKERVRYGALEYQKLFDKMRFYKNQKFNNEINGFQEPTFDESNSVRRRQTSNSTNSEFKIDSAIQDKTISQSARASSEDSENTLLDALLGSSFYNGTWNNSKLKEKTLNATNQYKNTIPATTTQPKLSQSSDFSHEDSANIKIKKENLAQKLSRCQIGQEIEPNVEDCEVCNYIFPTGTTEKDRELHINSHYGQQCPVCFLQFKKGYNQTEFELHVNSHFSN